MYFHFCMRSCTVQIDTFFKKKQHLDFFEKPKKNLHDRVRDLEQEYREEQKRMQERVQRLEDVIEQLQRGSWGACRCRCSACHEDKGVNGRSLERPPSTDQLNESLCSLPSVDGDQVPTLNLSSSLMTAYTPSPPMSPTSPPLSPAGPNGIFFPGNGHPSSTAPEYVASRAESSTNLRTFLQSSGDLKIQNLRRPSSAEQKPTRENSVASVKIDDDESFSDTSTEVSVNDESTKRI